MSKEKRTGGSGAKSPFKPRTKKPNFILSVILTTAKMMFVVALVVGVSLTGALVGVAKAWVETMPALDLSRFDEQAQTSYLYDKNGDLITDFKGTENRVDATYEELPKILINAVIASEDQRFWSHNGVDLRRLLGSIVSNLSSGGSQGGSTITQQLIKKTFLSDEQTYKRKLQEAYMALELEKQISKEDIITEYLNVVYFGEGAYGIQMAADTYFGKDVSELTLAECASIVAITNNPSRYDPFISSEGNARRRHDILYQMYDQGYIDYEEYQRAVAEEPRFVRGENDSYEAPIYSYYIEVVIDDVLRDLVEKKGLAETAAEQLLYHGGYRIYTCLDPAIQSIVDGVYQDTASLPSPYRATDKTFQSAIVIMDPYTGDVKALSGGTGTKTDRFGWNRATDAHRPAGSSIKPLAVYGPAFDLGLITQSTLVNDSASITLNGTSWYPRNYGGGYSGVVTIRTALINSLNTVAAQIMDKLTPAVSYEYLTERMGFQLSKADEDYAPLALGQFTNGVTVREMAQAFTSLVNDGVMNAARTYYLVTDSAGNIILDNRLPQSSTVFKANTARQITNILQGAVNGGTAWEANLGAMPAAGKTGTTSDEYDRWFCGYTPYYVAAVWTGYDMPSYMYFNGNPATQIWKRIMSAVHADLAPKAFAEPTYWGGPTNIFGDLTEKPEEEDDYTDPTVPELPGEDYTVEVPLYPSDPFDLPAPLPPL